LETELGEALNDKEIYLKSDRRTQLVKAACHRFPHFPRWPMKISSVTHIQAASACQDHLLPCCVMLRLSLNPVFHSGLP